MRKFILFSLLIMFSHVLWANPLIPPQLKEGDTVALISSGFYVPEKSKISLAKKRLEKLGLHVIFGKSIFMKDGYFAGSDKIRAQDINNMFANPNVKAIFELRGGWGAERTFQYLDFDLIKKHPKIIVGFSDITSLLLAIHKKTGLVTYHGPMPGAYPLTEYTTHYLKKILFQHDDVTLKNPKHNFRTIYSGTVTAPIIGGNLTVLTSLIGSAYFPDLKGKILFVEDVGENYYKIDRAMTQLKEAGALAHLKGFIFGTCAHCFTSTERPSKPLFQLIQEYIAPLKIPAWYGAQIGHQADMLTLPEGVVVKIDADQGLIYLSSTNKNKTKVSDTLA